MTCTSAAETGTTVTAVAVPAAAPSVDVPLASNSDIDPARASAIDTDDQLAQLLHAASGAMAAATGGARAARVAVDPQNVGKGLGKLVLTLVRLLHELLERQAIRRIESGSLTDSQIEDVGLTLMRQAEEIQRLAREFGVREDELNLDLGPVGRLL